MTFKQTEIITHKSGPYSTSTMLIEQVIAGDGKPAVLVSFQESYLHPGASLASIECKDRMLLRFPSRHPDKLLGMKFVGQWKDKVLQRYTDEQFGANLDESTYQDYGAWVDAFHEVYSES